MIDTRVEVPPAALPYLYRHRNKHPEPQAFADSLAEDYLQLLPFLPERAETLLDIGCGMAGIDVLLARHYPGAQLWLLDGDGDEPRSGWNASLGAFSSRAAADALLAANGLRAARWLDVGTSEALRADLVVSLASWGYHYPLSAYRVSGYCIADLRKGEEPARGTLIREYQKRRRCAWSQD